MAADERAPGKNAAGQNFDLSHSDTFDYRQFYRDMQDSERLQMSKDELTWMQAYVKPQQSADVVLNLSCGVQTTPHLMMTQVALFEALGVDFVATAGTQFCCGRIFQRFGKTETGDRLASKAIGHFASWQAPTNVQCCGSCLTEFQYQVGRIKEETGSQPFEIVHITRFLLDRLKQLDQVPWQRSIPRRVMLHAEGIELHPTKEEARLAVIETLGLIPGIEFVGMVDNPSLGSPCATSGPGEPSVLNDIAPEQYREVQAELRAQAQALGADLLVTHHHMCHREWSKFGSDALPVAHYQSLLAEALGISIPDRFQTLWQLGDPELVLEQSRRHWESWDIAEADAREMVQKHFVPKYASALQRCPCEGNCLEAVVGSRGANCQTSWDALVGIDR